MITGGEIMKAKLDVVKRRKSQFLHEFEGRAEKIY